MLPSSWMRVPSAVTASSVAFSTSAERSFFEASAR
jgi:hypothetical protein